LRLFHKPPVEITNLIGTLIAGDVLLFIPTANRLPSLSVLNNHHIFSTTVFF